MPPIRPFYYSPRPLPRIRQPARLLSHSSNVRYVKLKRPWVRRFLTTCLLYAAVAHVWSSSTLERLGDALDDDVESSKDSFDKRHEFGEESNRDYGSDSLFIPIGWPSLRKGRPYAKSDPEVQKLVELTRDKAKIKALSDELASIVLGRVSRTRLLSDQLGAPLTVYHKWLLCNFSRHVPDTYYRSGIEITDTEISWVQKPMSINGGEMLRRSMSPIYVALAVKDACTAFWKSFFGKFWVNNSASGRGLGFSDSSSKTLWPLDYQMDWLGNASQTDTQSSQSPNSQGDPSRINKDANSRSSIVLSVLQWLPVPKVGTGTECHAASLAFIKRINQYRGRQRPARQRGTLFLEGPIGINGPNGHCRVEVQGQYDPATSQWVSIFVFVREFGALQKKAIGGK